jgi:hypothetical protein
LAAALAAGFETATLEPPALVALAVVFELPFEESATV